MSTLYPGGDYPVTPNLGLALWDMSFEMAENMILIDTAVGSGSSVQINGSVISNPNFNNTTPAAPAGKSNVLWQVSGSRVSAYVDSVSSVWSALGNATADLTLANAGFNTTFNQTSATNWTWANTTAASAPSATYGFTVVESVLSDAGNFTAISPYTAPKVPSSGLCEPATLNTTYAAYWSGRAWGADQFSEVTVATVDTNSYFSPIVRVNGVTPNNYYQFNCKGSISGFYKIVAGVATQLGQLLTMTVFAGDKLRLTVSGNVLTLTQNGTLISTITDSTFAAGSPGFALFQITGAITSNQISSWTGGEFINQNSPVIKLAGTIYNGSSSVADTWSFQNVPNNNIQNPVTNLSITHSGSTGTAIVQIPSQLNLSTDTGISRVSAGLVAVGNGGAGDFTGALKLGAITEDNATAATSGASQSSPLYTLSGRYWDGAASQTDSWTMQDVLANGTNGTSTLTFTHSGTTGISSLSAPLFQAGVGSTTAASYSFAGHPTWGLWAAGGGLTPTFTGGGTNGQGVGVNTTSMLVGVAGGWFNFSVPSVQTPTQATPISIKPNLAFGYGTADAGSTIDIGFSRTTANNLAFGTTGVIGDTSGSLSFTNIVGSVIITQTATPAAPTVTTNFGSGASTWGYKVVAKDSFGASIGGAEGTVSNNATLSNATAGNRITIAAVAGAKTYDIYRTTVGTSPATTGKIATLTLTSAVASSNYIAYDVGTLTISSVANASGGNTVYTASMTNYASQTMIGSIFVIAGFVNGANNGTFTCVAQTGSSLTLNNSAGIAETHAATATQAGDGTTVPVSNTTGTLKLTAGLMDSTASLGSSGQVLSSTGTATQWIAQSSVASNAVQIQGVAVTSNTPQTGDALRYNLNGDNKWDVGGWLRPFIFGRADGHNIALANIGTGFTTYQITTSAGPTVNLASATEPNSLTINTGAAGTTTGRGVGEGNTNWSFGTFYRVSIRCQLQQTTNVRYWIGAGINIGSANATYSTDTPNTSYIAFRYSAGTDATIKAVCGTATASQTVVNTGVSVDTTASHVFEVTYDGTNVNFYIDGALKAQISTTLPATTALINSGVVVDNQNTANDQNFKICWLGVTVK